MMEGRSYYCGDVTEQQIGEKVVLKGWVQRRRDLGGLIFIDLRDRAGIVQVVFNTAVSEEAFKLAEKVRNEYVLEVEESHRPFRKYGKSELKNGQN